MAAAPDAAILEYARTNALIVVALDADFHAALATSGVRRPSVIRLRLEGLGGDSAAAVVHQVLQVAAGDLAAGAMVTVTPGNLVRVRRLPVA